MVTAAPSVIEFMPWQRRFFEDRPRVKVGCVHRQGGKDFVSAAEAVDDALTTGSDWYIVSMTQRQADQTHAKCRQIADVMKRAARIVGETRLTERQFTEVDRELDHMFRCTARTLHLPGGGTVTALPGRDPDTLAGLTGNVIFTEFGLFAKGGYDHWRVIFPLITRGYRIIVISTPRGRNTKFAELVNDRETYCVHFQTIEDSVAEGFVLRDNTGEPTDLETFKALYGDEAGWRREYLCEFTGDLEALVTWAKLTAAVSHADLDVCEITSDAGWDPTFFDGEKLAHDRGEIGYDVARHSDLSVVWYNVAESSAMTAGRRSLRYLIVMRNCTFALQREVVTAAMKANSRNVGAGDATGLGMDTNETLRARFGDRWLPFSFTASSKAELGSLARTAFDDSDQAIPPLDGKTKWIGTDLYAVQADRSSERLKLIETPNPLRPESHCDAFYAFALARKAAALTAARPHISTG